MTEQDSSEERKAFEAWASDDYQWPQCIERSGDSYKLMQTKLKWESWKEGVEFARTQLVQAEAVPQGWKLVPVEPTPAMVDAARSQSSYPAGVYRAMLAAVQAAVDKQAQAEAVPQWQPIETAPKDGQAILVSEGRFCYCVEWDEEFEWWAVDDNKLGPFRLRGAAPTHWMPLPVTPQKGTP